MLDECVRSCFRHFFDHRPNSNQNENQFKSRSDRGFRVVCFAEATARWGIFAFDVVSKKWAQFVEFAQSKWRRRHHEYMIIISKIVSFGKTIRFSQKLERIPGAKPAFEQNRETGNYILWEKSEEWKMVCAILEDTTKPTLWFLSALEQISSKRKTEKGDKLTGAKKKGKNI